MGVGQRKSKGGKGGHKAKNKYYKKIHATKNRCVSVVPDSTSREYLKR